MKTNHFINQRTIVDFLMGILLLATSSCDSCSQKELERERAPIIAQIETTKALTLGSVNTTQLVIEVSGQIKENNITDSCILGVLVIPTNESAEKAALDFRKTNKPLDKNNPYISLSNNKAVSYISEVPAKKKMSVSAKTFLQGGLDPGKYKVYLMLHNLSHGTYCSEEGQPLDIPNADPASSPTIKIVSKEAKTQVDHAGKSVINITAQADANNFGTMSGGFLFIEKKDPKINPIERLAEFIKNNKSLSKATNFEVVDTPNIIRCSFDNGTGDDQAQANNNLDKNDSTNLFKKSATYYVYAYLIEKVDEEIRYVVSKEEEEITIPALEVELEMKEAKIVKLIKSLDNKPGDVNLMEVSFAGDIKKQKGTCQPQIGFILSVNPLDITNDLALIENLLAVAPVNGYQKQGQNIAFLKPDTVAVNFTGEVPYGPPSIPEVPVELGQTYQVYFFLKDGGGSIVLSKNAVPFKVPSAELKITKFMADKDGAEFVVDENLQVTGKEFSDGMGNKTSTGYIMYATTIASISQQFLETILQNTNGITLNPTKDPGTYQSTLISPDMAFIEQGNIKTGCKSIIKGTVPSGTAFNVSLVFSCENAVFYKFMDTNVGNPDIHKFVWYQPDSVGGGQGPVNRGNPVQGDQYKYEYGDNYANAIIYKMVGKNMISVPLNETPGDPGNNKILIEEILSYVFQGPNASVKIRKFMDNMDTP